MARCLLLPMCLPLFSKGVELLRRLARCAGGRLSPVVEKLRLARFAVTLLFSPVVEEPRLARFAVGQLLVEDGLLPLFLDYVLDASLYSASQVSTQWASQVRVESPRRLEALEAELASMDSRRRRTWYGCECVDARSPDDADAVFPVALLRDTESVLFPLAVPRFLFPTSSAPLRSRQTRALIFGFENGVSPSFVEAATTKRSIVEGLCFFQDQRVSGLVLIVASGQQSAHEWELALSASSLRAVRGTSLRVRDGDHYSAVDFDAFLRTALARRIRRELSCVVVSEAALEAHAAVWEAACGDGRAWRFVFRDAAASARTRECVDARTEGLHLLYRPEPATSDLASIFAIISACQPSLGPCLSEFNQDLDALQSHPAAKSRFHWRCREAHARRHFTPLYDLCLVRP